MRERERRRYSEKEKGREENPEGSALNGFEKGLNHQLFNFMYPLVIILHICKALLNELWDSIVPFPGNVQNVFFCQGTTM